MMKVTVTLNDSDVAALHKLQTNLNRQHLKTVGKLMHRDLSEADVLLIALRVMSADSDKPNDESAG